MEISLTGADARRAWHDVAVLYFQFVIVAAVFGGVAWVAAGRGGGISDPAPDRPDVALPDDRQLGRADIDAARFTVGWRGYRMDEVDRVLDRLAAEIDYRDRLIAELSGSAGIGSGSGYGSSLSYEPVRRASEPSTGPAAGTTQTQFGAEGTAQGSAAEPTEPGAETDPDDQSYDENPLSAWYRRPEPPA